MADRTFHGILVAVAFVLEGGVRSHELLHDRNVHVEFLGDGDDGGGLVDHDQVITFLRREFHM